MTTYGALGQSKPAAATLTDVYAVPLSKHAAVRVLVCNTNAAAAVFRVSIAVAGAADNVKQYIAYDEAVAGNASASSQSVTLAAGDVVRVYSDTGNVAFTVTGIQNDE